MYRVGQKSDTARTYYIVRAVSLFWPTLYIKSTNYNKHTCHCRW